MAVTDNSASLVVLSDTEPSTHVTVVLDVEPTSSHEIGDLTDPDGKRAPESQAPTHFPNSAWALTFETEGPDPSGTTSLRNLLAAIEGKGTLLAELRPRYEVRLHWAGYSDSGQGGFVVDADLFAPLAALGCDLYATVYLDD